MDAGDCGSEIVLDESTFPIGPEKNCEGLFGTSDLDQFYIGQELKLQILEHVHIVHNLPVLVQRS